MPPELVLQRPAQSQVAGDPMIFPSPITIGLLACSDACMISVPTELVPIEMVLAIQLTVASTSYTLQICQVFYILSYS